MHPRGARRGARSRLGGPPRGFAIPRGEGGPRGSRRPSRDGARGGVARRPGAVRALPAGATILVVSGSPILLQIARALAGGLRGDDVLVEARLLSRRPEWRRLLPAADVAFADALAAPRSANRARVACASCASSARRTSPASARRSTGPPPRPRRTRLLMVSALNVLLSGAAPPPRRGSGTRGPPPLRDDAGTLPAPRRARRAAPALEARHRGRLVLEDAGRSVEGRSIHLATLGSGPPPGHPLVADARRRALGDTGAPRPRPRPARVGRPGAQRDPRRADAPGGADAQSRRGRTLRPPQRAGDRHQPRRAPPLHAGGAPAQGSARPLRVRSSASTCTTRTAGRRVG
jgi:hypothetical protein